VKGRIVIVRVFSDRDINFAKLFAQKFTHSGGTGIALVAGTLQPAGIVFAQTPSSTSAPGTEPVVDMGALLKQVLASAGGRGGGGRDFAQGGVPEGCNVEQLLGRAADTIKA
jgi:alanyl-tRNA synthetase